MASMNMTTNERLNAKKYSYLMDGRGRFYNPYDKGLFLNLLEFFHFITPLSEEKFMKRGVNEV